MIVVDLVAYPIRRRRRPHKGPDAARRKL